MTFGRGQSNSDNYITRNYHNYVSLKNLVHLKYLFAPILHWPIQGHLGGEVNILKDDSIGHGQKNNVHTNSEH